MKILQKRKTIKIVEKISNEKFSPLFIIVCAVGNSPGVAVDDPTHVVLLFVHIVDYMFLFYLK